jgi:hypothetical protein
MDVFRKLMISLSSWNVLKNLIFVGWFSIFFLIINFLLLKKYKITFFIKVILNIRMVGEVIFSPKGQKQVEFSLRIG